MEKCTAFLIGIILSFHCYSQDHLFVLHPLVGDTIDRNEKLTYFLFPEINDSDFKFCTITHFKSDYSINVHSINESVTFKKLDSIEMRQAIVRLDKVMEYNANQEKSDSIKSAKILPSDFKDLSSTHLQHPILGSDLKETIYQEVISSDRIKGDAERHEQYMKGNDMFGDGRRIEFRVRHKKK